MGIPPLSPADSARAVAHVYGTSLLVLAPLAAAAVAALLARRSPAVVRVLVWKCAVAALLAVLALRVASAALTLPFVSWGVPAALASPLVVLGRAQVGASGPTDSPVPALVFVIWLAGAVIMSLRSALAAGALRRLASRAVPADGPWRDSLRAAAARLATRPVRLFVSGEQAVPATWGVLRPVIVVPDSAARWTPAQREAALLHELAHVRAGDALAQAGARLLCTLLWFHPAAWWVASRLRAECELACDERVLAAGVRRSDYAELLALAADGLRGRGAAPALAIASRAGLRARLRAILEPGPLHPGAGARHLAGAIALSTAVTLPAGLAQLAPSREVLDGLMRDARWESRAYAVTRLAQRPDTVAVARDAAASDPNPRVRAWAARALAARRDSTRVPLLSR